MSIACGLFQVDNGDAGTAELDVLVAELRDIGDGGQILSYELSQDSCACAV